VATSTKFYDKAFASPIENTLNLLDSATSSVASQINKLNQLWRVEHFKRELEHDIDENLLKVLADIRNIVADAAKGPQQTFGYSQYGRQDRFPNVPLEQLPKLVSGLPPTQALPPEKIGYVTQRLTEYAYSQTEFHNRSEKLKDTWQAYFGQWVKRPQYVDYWEQDTEMCRQLLQGVNPMCITCVKSLEQVPEDMRSIKLQGLLLEELILQKRLFILDYKLLSEVPLYKDMKFYAPIMLVYKEMLEDYQSRLNIGAIQLTRKPRDNKIYTPTSTTPNRYRLAKLHVACADNQYHQFIYHLGFTHLAMEPFAIAHHNSFNGNNHVIGKLLAPHFDETIGINFLARRSLISSVSPITDNTFSPGTAGALKLFYEAWKSWQFSEMSFPKQLAARGFDEACTDEVEGYYFRDDGFKIWQAIKDYVSTVVTQTYEKNADVAKDPVIQSWVTESYSLSKAAIPGFPKSINTKSHLIEVLTNIIFTCSAQHSAVNFPQIDYVSYVPNRPDSLYQMMPEGDADISEEMIKKAMPDVMKGQFQVSFAYILSSPAQKTLINLECPHPDCMKAHAAFISKLQAVEKDIAARNDALVKACKMPYPYLQPSRIATSIAI
jgi:arachidonate 5-lipoxygenase